MVLGAADRDASARARVCAAFLAWVAIGCLWPIAALGQMLDAAEAEALVRARHFEGLPADRAARIGPEGAARLAEMLGDPAEQRAHANILLALGHAGQPGAFEAIDAWADTPRSGELDRATFSALQVLPYAFGALARHDRRALERLSRRIDAAPASWHFRHHRGERLDRQRRRAALLALGLTGLPEADVILERAARAAERADRRADVEQARSLWSEKTRGTAPTTNPNGAPSP